MQKDRTATPLNEAERRRHKARNLAQSLLLLAGMGGLLALCAWSVVGAEGTLWLALGGVIALALGPRLTPGLMLRLYGARELRPAQFPAAFALLDSLTERAGLARRPRLYYIPSAVLNAFSLGRRDDAAVALTDGLLRALAPRELTGVLAHEISHIRNNDLWIMSLADTISRLTVFMSYFGLLLLVLALPALLFGGGGFPLLLVPLLLAAPSLASLLQLALSRTREYDADLDAAGLTGDPAGLAAALDKLERAQGGLWERIFLPGRRLPDPSLLRSHPPTAERIRRLLALRPPRTRPAWPIEAGFGPPAHLSPVRRPPRLHWTGTWH